MVTRPVRQDIITAATWMWQGYDSAVDPHHWGASLTDRQSTMMALTHQPPITPYRVADMAPSGPYEA